MVFRKVVYKEEMQHCKFFYYSFFLSVVSDIVNGRLHFLFKLVGFVTACFLVFYLIYLLKDYVHDVLLWAENQPPWAVVFIFIALFTLVSLPLAWGYIVVNLACGYLFGALYGLLVTVFTATIGVLIAHIISKVILIDHTDWQPICS